MKMPTLTGMLGAGAVIIVLYYLIADYAPKVAKLYVVTIALGLILMYRSTIYSELMKTKIGPYLFGQTSGGGSKK